MSEHTHRWDLYEPDDREKVFAECLLGWCDAILSKEEIERRLNATEQLSAHTAHRLAGGHQSFKYDDMLRAYAAAREGKNEKA